jgi:radical SAM-linked protein
MARMPDGPPPAPVVQRLRVRYAKRGRLRFSSHRDFQRALERALRRIAAPMAYSAGFTPHPKISYANAAPTGAASEAEYLELGLTTPVEPAEFAAALDDALPPGLDVLEAVVARTPNLVERLEASVWRIELPGLDPADADAAVATLLAAQVAEVSRMTKSGLRTFDVRSALVSVQLEDPHEGGPGEPGGEPDGGTNEGVAQVTPNDCAILRVVVRHLTPAVRPDDVLAALRSQALLAPPSPPRMTRLAQGPLDVQVGTVADPLANDRDVAGV